MLTDAMRLTSDGYLLAPARVARAGVEPFTADEIERYSGRRFNRDVRVYTPPEELFDPATLRSLARCTVTLGHPPEKISSRNWRDFAVGTTGDLVEVLQDGDHLRIPLMLTDAAAVAAVQHGQRELSPGWDLDELQYEFTDGVTPDGERYDAVKRRLYANHVAIVERARGGPTLTLGDHTMTNIHDQRPRGFVRGYAFADAWRTRPLTDAAQRQDAATQDAIRRAYDERSKRMENSWRQKDDALSPAEKRDAAPPRTPTRDAAQLRAAADRAREERNERMRNAWRQK
jgi:hypothetical protein